jgi:O-antigen ligase
MLLRRLADAAVAMLFFLLLLASPLPMGGNREWAWGPMVVVVGALAVATAIGLGHRAGLGTSAGESRPLLLLALCFGLVIGVALLQLSPWAPSTASAAYYSRAAAVLGHANAPVPSLAVGLSVHGLLRCLACGLIFAMARVLCADERRARGLLMVLVGSALLVMVYALLGIATHSCFVGSYLKKWGDYNPEYDHCLMSGTFVNSNSFGCFIGMALVATIALILSNARRRWEPEEEVDPLGWITGTRLALVAIGLLFGGGLLFSGSRAGFAATILGLAMLGILLGRRRLRSRRQWGGVLVTAAAVGSLVLVLAGNAFMHKVAGLSEAGSINRVVIWKTTLRAIEQSPWLGWGFGSFSDIYAVLQPAEIPQANDKAHSTPLETVLELGIPGGAFAILSVLLPWMTAGRAAWRRRRRRYLPAAAFAASAVAILHSTIDFSLQMPAIAFFVSALLGMGWAQAFRPDDPSASLRSDSVKLYSSAM